MQQAWLEKGGYMRTQTRQQLQHPEVITRARKILVIRHCAFGDMMATRPFLVELRRLCPQAQICLSLLAHYQYAAPVDLVDEVHIWDKKAPWWPSYRAIKALGKFDLLFDLASTSRSRILTRFVPAKIKLGFPYQSWLNPLLYDIGILRSDFHYEAEILLDFIKVFGHQPEYPLNFALPQHQAAPQQALVYFPFAAMANKCWPQAAWKDLLAKSALTWPEREHQVLAGKNAHEQLDFLQDLSAQYPQIKRIACESLPELTQRLTQAACLIAGDTGVRNLALATHTPTLGIFFKTVPYRYWPRYEPWHDAVFDPHGNPPSPDQVFACLQQKLKV